MKLFIFSALAAVALTAVAINAGASNDDYRSRNAQEQWLSKQQVRAQLEQLGYQVHRLEADDGCFEAYVTDRSGTRSEKYVDPMTGMPGCQGEYEDHES